MATLYREFSTDTKTAWIRKNSSNNLRTIPLQEIKKLVTELKKDFPNEKEENMEVLCFDGPEYRNPGFAVSIQSEDAPYRYRRIVCS